MATTIFFNGRIISIPGAYTAVNSSGLTQVGLSASGIVAVIGQAVGGMPYTAITSPSQIPRLTLASQAATMYKSGDLLEANNMLFSPSNDPNISGGAQVVIPLKVNPATQASVTLNNTRGASLVVTSKDWGAFTSQINVTVQAGSTQGVLFTTVYQGTTESQDNLGGTNAVTLQYNSTATSWATMTAGVESTGSIHATGTRSFVGTSGTIAAITGGPLPLSITASSGDAGKTLNVYGVVGGAAVRETVTLINGTATSINSYTTVYGLYLSAAASATITVAASSTTLASIAAAGQNIGCTLWTYGYVANTTVSFVASTANTTQMIVEGYNTSGTLVRELLTLTGTTPVTTVNSYSQLLTIATANVTNSVTVTATAQAAYASTALGLTTIALQQGYFLSRSALVSGSTYGFVLTVVSPGTSSALAPSILDQTVSDVTCFNVALGFTANLYAVYNWINTNSQLITAAPAAGAIGAPSATGGPIFLAGGTEGTATQTDWQNCLNLLQSVRVNTIVPLTASPAVQAATDAHCAFMCGAGRSERDAVVGIQNAAGTNVPALSDITSQIQALNTRNLRVCIQAVSRYNTQGNLQEFLPQFTACYAAGMQAAAPVGTPLTFKYINAVSTRGDSSYNIINNGSQLIGLGAMALQTVDGQGIRWLRNVTAWLQDSNLANCEASVNQAVNFFTYNFRMTMEQAVGKPGFAGTVNAARSIALTALQTQIDAGVITAWNSLNISLNADVLQVGVQIAPVIGINFVPITVHLVNNTITGNTNPVS